MHRLGPHTAFALLAPLAPRPRLARSRAMVDTLCTSPCAPRGRFARAALDVDDVPPERAMAEAVGSVKRARVEAPTGPLLKYAMVLEGGRMPRPPVKGSALSAGFDLAAALPALVPARGRCVVKTGLRIAVPEGCYGRVAPRSGLAVKRGVDVGAGVVDADYRGEVGVVLFNFGDVDFVVEVGDRVAQLVLEKVAMVDAVRVEELDDTVRGAGGFGSTGVVSS